MITLFALPKAFQGHNGIIQENAIRSWKHLHPEVEIILGGDDDGIEAFADREGCRHIPNVQKTSRGTPILRDLFLEVNQSAQNKYLCFINADIILLKDILRPLHQRPPRDFLIVGRRYNVDLDSLLDFDGDWENHVQSLVDPDETNKHFGSDFFLFPKGSSLVDIPPFAVGRPAWDNWMFLNCLRNKIPLVDSLDTIVNIHQNHDYSHVKNANTGFKWEGPEGNQNRLIYLKDIYRYSAAHRECFQREMKSIEGMEDLDDPVATQQIKNLIVPHLVFRSAATHFLSRQGTIHPFSLRKRVEEKCRHINVFYPGQTLRQAFLFRLRGILNCLHRKKA